MPTLDELIALLPRMRRYARILTNDPIRADDIVAAALSCMRKHGYVALPRASVVVQHFAVLRRVFLEQEASPAAPAGSGNDATGYRSATAFDIDAQARRVCTPVAHTVLQRVLSLATEDREVITLVAVERLSYEDIGRLLDLPMAAVLARLSRARTAMIENQLDSGETPSTDASVE